MKTTPEQVAKMLKPLHPCQSGIDLLLEFKSLERWFSSSRVPLNHKMYLWLVVACADADDIYAQEISDWWGLEYWTGRTFPLIDDIKRVRLSQLKDGAFYLRAVGAATPEKSLTTHFSQAFRCPSDADLELAAKWIKSLPSLRV